jgi:hypothetical protein
MQLARAASLLPADRYGWETFRRTSRFEDSAMALQQRLTTENQAASREAQWSPACCEGGRLQLSSACIRELPTWPCHLAATHPTVAPSHIRTPASSKSGCLLAGSSHLSREDLEWQQQCCSKTPTIYPRCHSGTEQNVAETFDGPGNS